MSEITFNATVTSIVKFEKETGKSLITAFQNDISFTTIVELVKATSNAKDEDVDAYVKEFGLESLINKLTEALTDSGFLAKSQEATDKK